MVLLNSFFFICKPATGRAAQKGYAGIDYADKGDSEFDERDHDAECNSHDEPGGACFNRKGDGRVISDAAQRVIESERAIRRCGRDVIGRSAKIFGQNEGENGMHGTEERLMMTKMLTPTLVCYQYVEGYGWFSGEVASYNGECYQLVKKDKGSRDEKKTCSHPT